MRIWKNGPPPHIGWWNASIVMDDRAWRWWDGEYWSMRACPANSREQAMTVAKTRSRITNEIMQWTDYWPENARVPRVAPRFAPQPKPKTTYIIQRVDYHTAAVEAYSEEEAFAKAEANPEHWDFEYSSPLELLDICN